MAGIHKICIAFALLALSANACLLSFAALTADDADLAARTYVRLLDELGRGLTPQTIQEIVASNDPFAIPEQTGTDLGNLRSKMREFRAMLEQLHAETPELRARLLLEIKERLLALASQTDVRTEAIQRSQGDRTIQGVGGRTLPEPGHGADWVLVGDETHRAEPRWATVYPSTGIVQPQNLRRDNSAPTVTAGGKYVVTGVGLTEPLVHPVNSGIIGGPIKFSTSPIAKLGRALKNVVTGKPEIREIKATSSPNKLFVVWASELDHLKLTQFDASTGTSTSLDTHPVVGAGRVNQWGTLPGTEDLFFVVREYHPPPASGATYRLVVARVDGKRVMPLATWAKWKTKNSEGFKHSWQGRAYPSYGRTIAFSSVEGPDHELILFVDGVLHRVPQAALTTFRGKDIADVKVLPDGTTVLIRTDGAKTATLRRLDLTKGTETGHFELPRSMRHSLTADGSALYSFDETHFRIVNYEEHFAP